MIDGLSVLAVIPARGGSKGVPRKNVLPVGGRPMIAWTVAAAHGSRLLDRVILSSDDDEIIAVAQASGCEAPFRRAPALSGDDATSLDVVIDALDRVPGHDLVVLLQPTSPLRTAGDIDAALELLVSSRAPSCVSVCEAENHPWLTFAPREGRLAPYCDVQDGASLRRQDLPLALVLNGAVYAARADRVRAERRLFHPGQSVAYIMPGERSYDVDSWDDIRLVDKILSAS
jgi:CMP-N,N'-diacetyllegionaminic acid synthase